MKAPLLIIELYDKFLRKSREEGSETVMFTCHKRTCLPTYIYEMCDFYLLKRIL